MSTTVLSILFASAGAIITSITQNLWFLFMLSPLLIMGLFVAPYKLWKDQKKRADQLEINMKPLLKVIGENEQKYDQMGEAYQIEIENIGKEDANKCHGRLLDLQFEIPKDSISLDKWPRNRDLHWSGQVANVDHYDFPGSVCSTLNVVYCDVIDEKRLVMLAYRGEEQFRRDHALPQDIGAILVLIRVPYEGHEAINLVCRIDPKMIADKTYRAYSTGKPFELKWHGTEAITLGDFQKSTNLSVSHMEDSQIE